MRFPTVFINHGGGPLPLMGKQPELTHHMQQVVNLLPSKPTSIVVLSAHWEANPIQISNANTGPQKLLFDYYGFPPETYTYDYPAPGNPELSLRISNLLQHDGIDCELENASSQRGLDHGVFIPLKLMYPNADIPVVAVSLSTSLDAKQHINIGKALLPLRDDGILILGSGYTFHNLKSFFHPSNESIQASNKFNIWLKDTLSSSSSASLSRESRMERLANWTKAPGARQCHPREEHLLPLFMVAGAGDFVPAQVIYDTTTTTTSSSTGTQHKDEKHGVTGYLFN